MSLSTVLNAIIDDDVRTEFSDDPSQFAIAMCDVHHEEITQTLGHHATMDALLKVSHGLTSLAAKTIGTQSLVKARCPVCALRTFPYVQEFCQFILERQPQ